ncbi:MAG TPA: TolC family protein, partial [Emticicia sp.]
YLNAVNQLLLKQGEYLNLLVNAATVRLRTGEGTLLEKTTAETRQLELEQIRKQSEGMVKSEKLKIQRLLNMQGDFIQADTTFQLSKPLVTDSVYINQNPVLQQAIQQVRIAEANKNLDNALRRPDLSAGYFIQSLTGNQEVEGKTIFYNGMPRFQGITLGISIPIFGRAANARVRAAETEILVQQKNADYLKTQLITQLLQQMEEQRVNQSLLNYYTQTALPNAEIIVRSARKAFENGEIGYVEYLQGLETALSVQQNYLKAINQFNQNNINIQYLLNN